MDYHPRHSDPPEAWDTGSFARNMPVKEWMSSLESDEEVEALRGEASKPSLTGSRSGWYRRAMEAGEAGNPAGGSADVGVGLGGDSEWTVFRSQSDSTGRCPVCGSSGSSPVDTPEGEPEKVQCRRCRYVFLATSAPAPEHNKGKTDADSEGDSDLRAV